MFSFPGMNTIRFQCSTYNVKYSTKKSETQKTQEINNTQEDIVQSTETDTEITQMLNVSGRQVNLTTINILIQHGKNEQY